MNLIAFVTDNRTLFIAIAIILIFTIIGFFAQKTEFGHKVIEKSQGKLKEVTEVEENSNEPQKELDPDIGKVGLLDALAPNINDGGLMVGDVNQNPDKTNAELGIDEDLYIPFGDSTESVSEKLDNLQIEEVASDDDFTIIEREKNKNDAEVFGEPVEDLSVPVEEVEINPEELAIEEVEPDEQQFERPDPIVDEISELVDNTYVINDATEEFENMSQEQPKKKIDDDVDVKSLLDTESVEKSEPKYESKIKNFEIEEDETPINDFEIEQTTSLKLDEINEQIKNLKLEDSDTSTVDVSPKVVKKPRKNKKVSVKTVDEIKNKINDDKQDVVQNQDIGLSNLDENASKKVVNEADDMWKF